MPRGYQATRETITVYSSLRNLLQPKKHTNRTFWLSCCLKIKHLVEIEETQDLLHVAPVQISVVDGGEGRCVCELVVTPEMSNPLKSLHGGMTATIVDAVSTWAVMTLGDRRPGVSVDLSVSYLQPAPVGEPIVIAAQTLRLGKKLAFLTVDITRKETGKLVAQGKHTKYMDTIVRDYSDQPPK